MFSDTDNLTILGESGKTLEDAIVRNLCESSLYEFLTEAWPYFDPAPFAGNWHIGAIAEHLQAVSYGQIRKLLINVRPRSGKTALISIAWPTWTWAKPANKSQPLLGPGVRFLCGSYGAKKAQEDAVTARRLIGSEWYQKYWGARVRIAKDRDNAERYDTEAGGSRISTGIPESLGKGGIIRILDDPHKTNEVESEAVRESVVRDYKEIWQTRQNDPNVGAEVMVMQRQAENDLSGYWLENFGPELIHLCIPAWYEADRHCTTYINGYEFWTDPREDDGESFWPRRFGSPKQRREDEALGKFAFAGQIQQRPEPRGGGIIQRMWWQAWPPDELVEHWTDREGRVAYPPWELQIAYLDTAFTKKETNDPCAMTRFGVFANSAGVPCTMLCGSWQAHHNLSELVARVIACCRAWKTDYLIIENKAGGVWVRDEIIKEMRAGEWEIILDDPVGDKVARAQSVVPLFTGKLVYAPFVHQTDAWRAWAEEVILQVERFPAGKDDHLVDCVTGSLGYLRRNGLIKLQPEHDEDVRDANVWRGRSESVADRYEV